MKRKNSHFPIMVFLICGALIAAGCKKEEPAQAPSAPNTPKPAPAVKVQPPVQQQQTSAKKPEGIVAESNFSSKKDPFKSFIVVAQPQAAKPVVPVVQGDLLPIQSYETSKFKVAGIIVGLKENTALVIDPTGKGYVVKQGMLIGNGNGRISRISAAAIDVVENFRDEKGHIQKRTIKLILPQKK
jgi:type IV pilus assembly protein PilP